MRNLMSRGVAITPLTHPMGYYQKLYHLPAAHIYDYQEDNQNEKISRSCVCNGSCAFTRRLWYFGLKTNKNNTHCLSRCTGKTKIKL